MPHSRRRSKEYKLRVLRETFFQRWQWACGSTHTEHGFAEGEYTIALIPAILRHEYVQSLEASHKDPSVFVDFIAERIIATQRDLLRLLRDGGVNTKNGGVNGGVNLSTLLHQTICEQPGKNAPALAGILQKSLRTIQRHLKMLSDQGLIEFRGAAKNGGYYSL